MDTAEMRRRWRRARRGVGSYLVPRLAPSVLAALSRSWKVDTLGDGHMDEARARPGMLATLWHGRMIVPITAQANQGFCVLVSPSDDGKLVLPLLEKFGYKWVFGSSNKNPARAVRELLDRLQAGGRIVITPDGPRGPRHGVNRGAAWMARETGFPILPVGCAADRAWHLRSWDHFTIPKFGARVAVVYGELLYVEPGAGDDALEGATQEMKRRMLAAEELGFRHLGATPDW